MLEDAHDQDEAAQAGLGCVKLFLCEARSCPKTWLTRLQRPLAALAYDLHQARICLGEMVFFVRQVEYYCHLEVVACQWAELEDFVAKGEGDLDKLVDAHRKYLTKLADKALLKAQGRRKKEVKPLVEQLRDIWKVMLQWKNVAVRWRPFSSCCFIADYPRPTGRPLRLRDAARVVRARDLRHSTGPSPSPFPLAAHSLTTGSGAPVQSAPLHLRPPTAEQLEKLEDRLASYGTLFRERATELVVGLERSPDLDMKFLAVRLNFNYQFRTFRSLVSLCVRVRAYSGPADGQERAQDRIRRAQSRRRDRPLLVSLPSHTSVAVVLPRISADVPCVSSREAAESLMCSQGRSRSATPLGPLLGPAQARRPSLFRGRLWRAHARTEEKPRRFRELAPNSAP